MARRAPQVSARRQLLPISSRVGGRLPERRSLHIATVDIRADPHGIALAVPSAGSNGEIGETQIGTRSLAAAVGIGSKGKSSALEQFGHAAHGHRGCNCGQAPQLWPA